MSTELSSFEQQAVPQIIATPPRPVNNPLDAQTGDFREDLMFRVNTFEIALPSLRERIEDVPELARHLAGRFRQGLRPGDEVFTPIAALSYGERARLQLAQLVLGGANFLILDEPLNHLDIGAREKFEAAVQSFPGAVLVVTHDRAFIERLVAEDPATYLLELSRRAPDETPTLRHSTRWGENGL